MLVRAPRFRLSWLLLAVVIVAPAKVGAGVGDGDGTEGDGPSTLAAGAPYPDLPHVTLHLHDVTRKELLDSFAEQTHVSFGAVDPNFWSTATWPEPTVDIDFDNQPFWEALAKVQETADIGFVPVAGFKTFCATKSRGSWGWTGRPEATCGPLLLSVRRVTRQEAIELAEPKAPISQMQFEIVAQPMPGQQYVADETGLGITAATDENDRDLLAGAVALDTKVSLLPKVPQVLRILCRLTIPAVQPAGQGAGQPSGQTAKLVSLAGTFRCVYVSGSATIERADAEQQPIDCEIMGRPMQLTVERRLDRIEVQVTGTRPSSETKLQYGRFAKRLFTFWSPAIVVTDGSGKRLNPTTADSTFDGNRSLSHFDFTLGASPISLSWALPAAEQEYTFPWHLDQIPLP